MNTIIQLKYADLSEKDKETKLDTPDKEILVNINCPIGAILNYIRSVAGLDNDQEFDLCDATDYQLEDLSIIELHKSGLNVFQPGLTYLIIAYERDVNGQKTNLTPIVSAKAAKKCIETLTKPRKTAKKNLGFKTGFKKDTSTYRTT